MNKNILFLTRNGLLEPLGQSQILSYLKPLSKDFSIHIISFEKAKDLENVEHLKSIQSICNTHTINWIPLSYRKTFRALGVVIGFFELFFKTYAVSKKEKIDLIHARSYYPAFITWLIFKLRKIPFIFDMRALWPEELIESGRLKEKSWAYRVVKNLEQKCLRDASAVVSLTHAAVDHLEKTYPNFSILQKTAVIPTCANLDRFQLKEKAFNSDAITLSCVGSMLSGWFKLDYLKSVIHYYLNTYPNIQFRFVSRDSASELEKKLELTNFKDRVQYTSVLFEEMPNELKTHDGSVFFFTANISKLGSAPTRMGELLGTGIPVLTNSGVGDVGSIIKTHKVGILLHENNEQSVKQACEDFLSLIAQKDIQNACRKTAETLFSLESGVTKYQKIYKTLLYQNEL